MLVSNAQNGSVAYALMREAGDISDMHLLITEGLVNPQGMFVDRRRSLLLIADSGLRKVVSYGLRRSGETLVVDAQTTVAAGVETRWVTSDGPGNVYFTDEQHNKIYKVAAIDVNNGRTQSAVLFDAGSMDQLSAPGGLATDNFYLYWTNKMDGVSLGSVVRALQHAEVPDAQDSMEALAKSTPKTYGVCLALSNVIYTDSDNHIYATTTAGGSVVTVNSSLTSPRGCAWDGDGTVYVADRSLNGVFALDAPMSLLQSQAVRKVVTFEEAFGVAVFSRAASERRGFWQAAALAVAAILVSLH